MPKTFDIVMAVFDVGSHVVTQAAASISGSTSLDVQARKIYIRGVMNKWKIIMIKKVLVEEQPQR